MKLNRIGFVLIVTVLMFFISTSLIAAQESTSKLLNVNTATLEELSAVPGLSPDLAQKIIDYRNDMGDITNIDELKEIDGITPEVFEQIKGHIGVEGIEGSDCTC